MVVGVNMNERKVSVGMVEHTCGNRAWLVLSSRGKIQGVVGLY